MKESSQQSTTHTTEERGKHMDLEQIKYHTCPYDQEEGILVSNIDETEASTDNNGDLQYYCMAGRHTFSVDEEEDNSWGRRR